MSQKIDFTLDFAAATDIGCVRGNNEDSFGYDAEQHLYVVCDGMGGSAAGEVASGMAVRALIENFEALGASNAELTVDKKLLHAIRAANRAVRDASEANPQLHNMGTTLVCASLDGARLVIGNVGDSRAYLIRAGVCQQVTLDHSLVDEQLRQGLITPEMAAVSNLQSVITRAIGAADAVEPDLFGVELQMGDMFLLTSDGLTRYAKTDVIAGMASGQEELPVICQRLIEHAKQSGGVDNITCMMLRVVEVPAVVEVSGERVEDTVVVAEAQAHAEAAGGDA